MSTVNAPRFPNRPHDDSGAILVIEDEAPVRALIRRLLRGAGYLVVDAANGLEGLRIVEANVPPIEAVLTDLRMPVIDGYVVAEVLSECRPDLPVIAMSADVDVRALPLRVRAVLAKPFRADTLTATLGPILDAARVQRAVARQQRADAMESRSIAALQREQATAARDRNAGLVDRAMALQARLGGR
jgi:CheY-like chemotaxis protein